MKPFEVKDFNGGMVDEFDDCAPRFSQRMRNLLLDPSGKPYQRNGTSLWAAPMPTGEKIGGLRVIKDISNYNDFASYQALVYSHRKVWISAGAGGVDQAAGPTGFSEIVGANGNSIAQNVSVATKAKIQETNNHIFLSFQNRDQYADPRFHPRPRKIYPIMTNGAGVWTAANMGLPFYIDQGFVGSGGGTGTVGSYVYYFVYKFVYTILSTTYVVFGTPSVPTVFASTPQIGVSGGFHSYRVNFPANGAYNDIYPLLQAGDGKGTLFVSIYRTVQNQTVPRLVMDVPYAGTNDVAFTDNVPDANLGAPLYTADGSAGYDEPPPCKIFHAVGDYGYYGGFDVAGWGTEGFPNGFIGAIQSSPAVLESAPGSFTIATPDHLTAIESVDQYPIFFWRRGCARVEGNIDSYGNGSPVLRMISEKAGALRQSGVRRTDRGLLFCAEDGIYFTDGFAVKKLTDHLNKYYRRWWHTGDSSSLDDMALAYHGPSKRYFVGARLASAPSDTVAAPNTVIVGDLTHENDEGGAATTYLDGQPNLSTLGYSFLPTALDVYRDTLLFGDFNGAVQAVRLDPPTADVFVDRDCGSDGSVANANWISAPVVWDYIGPAIDFGARMLKKYVTRLNVAFKFPFPQTSLFAQIFTYVDMQFRSDAQNAGAQLNPVQETAVPLTRRFLEIWRRMRKGSLRCTTLQVRIQKGALIIASSTPNGVRANAQVTLNAAGKTALLATGAWPANILGQTIYFDADGYAHGYVIKAVTTTTVTFLDPGGTMLTTGAGHEWEVKGYPLDQGAVLDSYYLWHDALEPGAQPAFNPASGGNNA